MFLVPLKFSESVFLVKFLPGGKPSLITMEWTRLLTYQTKQKHSKCRTQFDMKKSSIWWSKGSYLGTICWNLMMPLIKILLLGWWILRLYHDEGFSVVNLLLWHIIPVSTCIIIKCQKQYLNVWFDFTQWKNGSFFI
jgi:hypothetical protein